MANSRVDCDEHVTVTTRYDLDKAYGDHDWRTKGYPAYYFDDHAYKTFYAKAIPALQTRTFVLLATVTNRSRTCTRT